jgi:uncharacterized membrane protein
MTLLILGLIIFLGVHSTRIVAPEWRAARIDRLGEKPWKGLFSLASAVGLVVLIWGYGLTRENPVFLWDPPRWTVHVTSLLTLPAFILLAAAYVPGNRIKAAIGHPMVAGVKVWALAHLLSNGRLGDVVLFGAFLLWALVDFRSSRRRDREAGTTYPAKGGARDAAAVAAGLVAWALFAGFLHTWLIGVRPY